MMFILRAAFWLAVVAAFVPPGFTAAGGLFASDMERLLAEPAARASESLQAQTAPAPARSQQTGICADYGELCDIWDHVTGFGGYVGSVALSQADAMIETAREAEATKPARQTR
ncbi:hypothetical protein [Glycocaulis abyssi]|uniref:Uncharacterized protein n=1 Tax=Glycocaulis abyssi TaxID=1433403 RepID=A0ABV9N7Q7_9PROT